MALALWATLTPGSAAAYPEPGRVTGDTGIHDPTMVRTDSGYVLYGSNSLLEARTSPDRTAFSDAGSAFAAPQDWWAEYSPERNPWAPDLTEVGGTYYLYYAVSTFGSRHSAIGLATSPTGAPGSFTDHGEVLHTDSGSAYNAIDPDLLIDPDGRWRLTFGSWGTGIHQIELDPATGKPASGAAPVRLASAGGGIEGPTLVRRGGFYYLFSSYGTCCAGTDSTYRIRVGRSSSPTGPFTDQQGNRLLDGGGTPVLESHGSRVVGPGGQDILPDVDGDLLVYHYYDAQRGGAPTLGVNLLDWSSGWPVAY
nr:arabinan endo-1,5-alpha-L-arabinosidase [Streptomyces boncukensis]